MKEKMYSAQSHSLLHDHILDGFAASHEGIKDLKEKNLIDEHEYLVMLERNISRLIDRIREFRITQKITCVAFAFLFGWLQANSEDLEMRRAQRTRPGRRVRREQLLTK